MTSLRLPPIVEVATLPEEEQKTMLDILFEPSPALHSIVLPLLNQPYASYTDLISVVRTKLVALAATPSGAATVRSIIAAHPRLGEKRGGTISASSAAEQASLGQHGGDGEEEQQELETLNAEYEAKFPGLRYVVFVNRRGRREILGDMRWRIERGDGEAEKRVAIEGICDIAVDRAVRILRAARGEVV